ncbi:hypothetical protein ASD89_19805 [Caulobacter sp. Root656]|nr:hypothetical protein ASD89_19805 [Caulobacter sp. Root656]
MDPSDQTADFRDLMSSVGMLLLHWGRLERRKTGTALPEGLQEVRRMRNTVCHDMETASADPTTGREPFIRCCDPDGAERIYTYSDLQAAIRTLEGFNGRATD